MNRKPSIAQGFTLVEVLVALFVFSILGTMSFVGLRSVIHTDRRISQKQQFLERVSLAEILLRRDIIQIVDRPVILGNHIVEPSVMSKDRGLAFTRTGIINPFNHFARSDLERVAYLLKNHQLIRFTWPSIENMSNEGRAEKILLKHIDSITIRYISQKGQESSQWPQIYNSNSLNEVRSPLPKAITVRLMVHDYGQLNFIFPLVSEY